MGEWTEMDEYKSEMDISFTWNNCSSAVNFQFANVSAVLVTLGPCGIVKGRDYSDTYFMAVHLSPPYFEVHYS